MKNEIMEQKFRQLFKTPIGTIEFTKSNSKRKFRADKSDTLYIPKYNVSICVENCVYAEGQRNFNAFVDEFNEQFDKLKDVFECDEVTVAQRRTSLFGVKVVLALLYKE